MHLIRDIKIWYLGRRTALSLWMLPFQLSLPTERTRAHRRWQCHWDVHPRCEPHEASSLSTSTSIAPEGIFFTAHNDWGADAALIRSPNSKIGFFDGEKGVKVSITEKRSQWDTTLSKSSTSGCWICTFAAWPASSYSWTNFTASHCELLYRSRLLIRSQHWETSKFHLVFSNTIEGNYV